MSRSRGFTDDDDDDELEPYEVTNGVMCSSTPTAKKWVIDTVIPEGITMLHGLSTSSKTFVALGMAGSITTGRPWLEKFPVQQGVVVYVKLEGDLTHRWLAWQKENGFLLSNAEREELKRKFNTAGDYKATFGPAYEILDDDVYWKKSDQDDAAFEHALREHPIANFLKVEDAIVTLTDPNSVKRLVLGIKKQLARFKVPPPVKLIIIDTVGWTMGDWDENTQLGMGRLLRGARFLRLQFTPKAHVLLLHHPTASKPDKPRGSGALPDGLDARISLKVLHGVRPEAALVPLFLKNEKVREGGSFGELWLTRREISLVDPGQEASLLAEENNIREKAGLPLLEKLDKRVSCIIEETSAADFPVRASQPATPLHAAQPHGKGPVKSERDEAEEAEIAQIVLTEKARNPRVTKTACANVICKALGHTEENKAGEFTWQRTALRKLQPYW